MLNLSVESEILKVVRTTLCDTFSWFDKDDPLVVEQHVGQVYLFYSCLRASRGDQATTLLECRFNLDASEGWIGRLQVSSVFRLQGLGRELVLAAERISTLMDMREINIFPLVAAVDFWRKMGYTWKPRTARVLCKKVVRFDADHHT
jgi:GNAT superfamily N-acetyltransferase